MDLVLNQFFVFLLGVIIGSFLNVVIYRYNTGFGLRGRSQCLACGKRLGWHELIPILSYLRQGGRCAGCRSAISAQYPLVEFLSGALFLLVFNLGLGPVSTLLLWVIWSLLLVITVYDWRHKIIPEALVWSFTLLALIANPTRPSLLAGLGLAAFFAGLWYFSGGRWMGFGDAKLALGAGFLLGPIAGVSAIVLAFWIGAVVGVLLILFSRLLSRQTSYTMRTELPFAPFIILGMALVQFAHFNVFTLF